MRSNVLRALVALCALAGVLVPIVGPADARAAKAPALEVEQYPLQNPDPSTGPTIFVADGAVWSASGDEVHRVDPSAGPLVGYLTPALVAPYIDGQIARRTLWRLAADPDAAPCASPRPEENPEQPLSLRGIDLTGGATVRVIPVGWCAPRMSRTYTDAPLVAAAGGSVWISRLVQALPGFGSLATSARIDAASGLATPVDPPDSLRTFAADDDGAWAMGYGVSTTGEPTSQHAFSGLLTSSPLTRVGNDGSPVSTDMLRGAYWNVVTAATDPDGLWVASAREVPRSGGSPDPVLTRVTTAGNVTAVRRVRPWSIVSDDDGHTWFLGTMHRVVVTNRPHPLDWVLGRVDTRTGRHLRTYDLDLPTETVSGAQLPLLELLTATGGAVWLRAGTGSGTLVRVTEPAD